MQIEKYLPQQNSSEAMADPGGGQFGATAP